MASVKSQSGPRTITVTSPMGSAPDLSPSVTKTSASHYETDTRGRQINARTGQMDALPSGEIQPSRDMHSAFPGILGTARTIGGSPINDMSKINDNTRVTIQGAECEVGTAVQMGYLVKHADGTYAEPGSGSSKNTISVERGNKAKAQQQAQQAKRTDFVGASNKRVLNKMKEKGGDKHTDALVSKALAVAVSEPNLSGESVSGDRLAKEMERAFGLEPLESATFMENVLNEIQDNAARYMTKNMGVDGHKVMMFMHDKLSKTAQVSIMTGLYHGSKATLHQLVTMYKNGDRV